MVGVSYHELSACTKGRAERHTSGERKQFLFICAVAAAFLFNAFVNAGLFESVQISDDGIYPGGEFIYKFIEHKDYATTGGFWRMTRSHLGNGNDSAGDSKIYDDILYAVYIDLENPWSGVGRYFSGILIDESKTSLKQALLDRNENATWNRNDNDELTKYDHLPYEIGDLPSVRSVVATFPWTDGFVSALLHNYKVFPALRKYCKQHLQDGHKFVVSTTCNREKKVCVHYVPMIRQDDFLMGHPDTKDYEGHQHDLLQFSPKQLLEGFKRLFGIQK